MFRRFQKKQLPPPSPPKERDSPHVSPQPALPRVNLTSRLQESVLQMHRDLSTTKSTAQYEAIEEEWNDYCAYCYKDDPFNRVLEADKVYLFMYYQSYRPARQRGGKNRSKQRWHPGLFEAVMKHMREGGGALPISLPSYTSRDDAGESEDLPDGFIPMKDGVGDSTFQQYRACLHKIHKWQVARCVNARAWEHIWTEPLDILHKFVKKRKSTQSRANFEEKMEASFAPYQALDKYNSIEEQVWAMGLNNVRSCASSLRNRHLRNSLF